MKKIISVLLIVLYVSSPVMAYESAFLDFSFYTYPDFELKNLKVSLNINEHGKWQILSIDTDCDFSEIEGIYISKGSKMESFFSKVMLTDYENQKPVKKLKINDMELLKWTSVSEEFWLWKF